MPLILKEGMVSQKKISIYVSYMWKGMGFLAVTIDILPTRNFHNNLA